MDTVLIVMGSVLAAVFVLGYYMDWFGLWVSKKEMKKQIYLVNAKKEKSRG